MSGASSNGVLPGVDPVSAMLVIWGAVGVTLMAIFAHQSLTVGYEKTFVGIAAGFIILVQVVRAALSGDSEMLAARASSPGFWLLTAFVVAVLAAVLLWPVLPFE